MSRPYPYPKITQLCGLKYNEKGLLCMLVEVISEFEMQLMMDSSFQDRIEAFDQWERENHPAETDLAELEKQLET